MYIDLNCDLGETGINGLSASDEAIMPWITSANIACGFHAGSPEAIASTIRLALQHGAGIGAHPGYPDRTGFGRKSMNLDRPSLEALLTYQIGAVKCMAEIQGGKLRHVKPHGALYNDAAVNQETAEIIAGIIHRIDSSLILYGLSGSEMSRAAERIDLPFASEVFADRAYSDDGTLVSRNIPGAVLHDTEQVIDRAIRMVMRHEVKTLTGKVISLKTDTICIHGDNPAAPELARNLAQAFKKQGIQLKPFNSQRNQTL
jgi:5-oxoprolinase (ATP-hydrolysing) subunit A